MHPIVDTHQHLWDLSKFNLPWTDGDATLNRSFVTSDYLEATKDSNVAKAVYMEVDMAMDQKVDEAEYIIDLCQDDGAPTVAAVISGDPATEGFADYVALFKDSPYIKGLRQILHTPDYAPGYCLTSNFIKGVNLLGESNLSFDLCLRPREIGDAAQIAQKCPGTRFILDHCGNADPYIVNDPAAEDDPDNLFGHTRQQWMDDMQTVADQPNVICKISGIVARAKPGWTAADLAPTINHCLDTFGPDRVIFGGDWPVCLYGASYGEWAAALREVISNRSDEEQRKLLHDNAVIFYGL